MTNPTPSSEALPSEASLRERVEAALRGVYDPEIPVNIYELGLIYELEVSPEGVVEVRMTLTAPNCPAAGAMPAEIEARLRAIEGVSDVHVELVWDPPWDKSRMSEAARLELGLL
jgi:FeS assembly SUF system protein